MMVIDADPINFNVELFFSILLRMNVIKIIIIDKSVFITGSPYWVLLKSTLIEE
jgi:hypothetical protein